MVVPAQAGKPSAATDSATTAAAAAAAATAAAAGGTKRVGRYARSVVGEVTELHRRAHALLTAGERLRDQARSRGTALASRDLDTELRRTPIEDLAPFAGRGVRLGALRQAGFRTVADVLDAPQHDLERVPGVGPRTVREVRAAARRATVELGAGPRIRLDPDRRDRPHTELLGLLAAIRAADALPEPVRDGLAAFVAEAQPLRDAARPTTRWWRMALRGARRKQAALQALDQLTELRDGRRARELAATLATHEPPVDPTTYRPNRLWAEYLRDAAAVTTQLANLCGGRQQDTDVGLIPDELRRRITALPLDTSLVTSQLRRYQVFGAQYAIHQERCVLGDEMGLGKTVQALAVMAHLAARGQRRFLVVCPASVQVNWLNEAARHTRLTTHSLHGADRDRAARRWLREGGLAVTTFGTLGRLDPRLRSAEVAMLVVDEAHYIKNPTAERTMAVADVAAAAHRALFLTGTPMENRVGEFRSLVRHLQPWVADRVEASDDLGDADDFRRAVSPVYLRRNQEDVLDELPELIEVEDWVELSPRDQAEYLAAVESRNLMAMRQAAFASPEPAKLERLVEIVHEAARDRRKVVVFSFFLGVLDTVAEVLGDVVVGAVTGAVDPSARQALVDDFSARGGHAVLLAQIEAGGVGLNVQAASVVIITEPQWKPGTEDQAVARAHRMGQVRRVQVHRLLARDSVDERIREIQQGKRLLFDEYARKSDAKGVDPRAIDSAHHRPGELDDRALATATRVVMAEHHRLASRLRR
jgi:superfamily II DNA or RNA helicase